MLLTPENSSLLEMRVADRQRSAPDLPHLTTVLALDISANVKFLAALDPDSHSIASATPADVAAVSNSKPVYALGKCYY
jgi:hypothetical protein